MNAELRARRAFLGLGLLLALASPGAGAQTVGGPPRTIRVVMDDNYAPYSFRSADGRLQGILVDQWQLWEKQTGLKVELNALVWSEAVRRMRAREFDVIDDIVETEERRDYFDFTPSYASIEVPIFFRGDIAGITDLTSLRGFPVGIKDGDQHADKLREAGVTTLVPFPSFAAIIAAAGQHRINVFVADGPAARYLLSKAGLAGEFRRSEPIFRDGLQRAVHKGDAALLRTVTEGFAAIDPNELNQINLKWYGRTIYQHGDYLTYAAYAAGVALLLVVLLIGWNRALQKRVGERTVALSESEQRFRQIAENIHEVFWLTTADLSKTLYVSPGYETVWGRSRESLYQDPRSFITAIIPEDRPRVLEAVEKYRERGFGVEYRIVRPDGSVRWIWDRGFPIKDETRRTYRIAGIAEDITERKLAEEAVKQAEDRFRLIIDTIPTMAWSVRPDGTVDFLNQRWVDYAGLSLEEYVKDPLGPIHPEDVPGVMEKWSAHRVTGEPYDHEMRLRRADGVYRWFLVRTTPLRDKQGSVVKWFGASLDIEDRKEVMEALRQSEERFAAFMDNLPGYAWMKDLQGSYVYVNVMVRGVPGYRSLGKTDAQIWPADLAAEYRANDQQVIATKMPLHTVEHYQREGKQRHMVGSKFPIFDKTGAVALVGGVGVDITERVEAEEALRSSELKLREREEFYRLLTENTNDFIRMHELDGRSIYASPSVRQLYGREPAHLFQFAHPGDIEACRQWWARILAGSAERFVWRVRDRQGAWRWMETRASRVQHHGQPHVMTVCRDVTEQKEAEEAVRSSEQQLHALVGRLNTVREDEAKRIARELHDDLGQKLTALNMELADLEMKLTEATPNQRAQITRMHATVDQTIGAVQELSSELRLGQLDLLGLTAAIDWQLQEFSRRSAIPCVVTRLDEITNLSDARRTAVFRILQEALTNIVRHAGATRIEISLQAGPGQLTLRIHDNGRGITAAELHDLKAIGLLGMRERAQGVGGGVTITSEAGRGTTVLVTVPLEQTGRISP